MIIRIVKLIIDREKVDEFQLFFKKTKPSIGNFIGCSHVELLKETKKETFTSPTVIGKMKKCLKIIEIQIFLKVYGKIQKHTCPENLKHGV